MSLVVDHVVAFLAGALVEALYAYGVIVIAERRAKTAAVLSMVWMPAMRVGLGEALQSWSLTGALVLGYGFGSWAAVKWAPSEKGSHKKRGRRKGGGKKFKQLAQARLVRKEG